MYKNRITKWKLDKRNKEHEMIAVVRMKTERDAIGKASEFHVRGRVVSIADVHRYLKRKGMSIEDAIKLRATTPPELRCYTPDAAPSSPATPEIFEATQQILVSIHSYVLGSLDSKMWFLPNESDYHLSVKRDGKSVNPVIDFSNSLNAAIDLLRQGSTQRAGYFLVKGSSNIRDVVLEEDPRMLVKVLEIIWKMRRNGRIDCSNIFLNQFSSMATTILPDMHPLRHIFSRLVSLDPELAEDVLASAWESFLDTFEQASGDFSLSAIRNRAAYVYWTGRVRDPDLAEDQLRTLVEKCEEAYGSLDPRYAKAVWAFADFLCVQRRYTDAAAAAEEVVRCAGERDPSDAAGIWCDGMGVLAYSQYSNFDDELAESTLRQVVDVCSTTWGWQDGGTLRYLTTLERWLTEFGKLEEAAEVAEQIEEILRQSNAFV
jgi:hypothetical protein